MGCASALVRPSDVPRVWQVGQMPLGHLKGATKMTLILLYSALKEQELGKLTLSQWRSVTLGAPGESLIWAPLNFGEIPASKKSVDQFATVKARKVHLHF